MLSQIVIISSLIFLIFLFIEKYLYVRRIDNLSTRILVNGTRGKSSVTEFIAEALRASGQNTIGKITGVYPTIILSDGTKKIIRRFNGARLQEQIKTVRFASSQKANSLVLECMSIQPELQKIESRIFKPHIYVITNILNDHQEELGFSEEEQAKAICSAIPFNSIIVTNEKRFLGMIKSNADNRNSIVFTCDDKSNLSLDEYTSYNRDNMLIALKVCELLNLDKSVSKKTILKILNDRPPILTEHISNNKNIRFLNAFSVNDVLSTEKVMKDFENKFGLIHDPIFIFNSRADRPYRTIEFARWFGRINNIFRIYLIGNHSLKARKEIIKNGIVDSTIKILKTNSLNELFSDFDEFEHKEINVIGVGNIAGSGFEVMKLFIPENNLETLRL
jgi:gamma-polyglutamate synthase